MTDEQPILSGDDLRAEYVRLKGLAERQAVEIERLKTLVAEFCEEVAVLKLTVEDRDLQVAQASEEIERLREERDEATSICQALAAASDRSDNSWGGLHDAAQRARILVRSLKQQDRDCERGLEAMGFHLQELTKGDTA